MEDFTKQIIFADLAKGDPHWDVQHTEAVVFYVKEILNNTPELREKVDPIVITLAAYGHDWGYCDFYIPGKPMPKKEYMEAKRTHAKRGCEKMKKLLEDTHYDALTEKQKERILHLILVHDNYDTITASDELVLMEADTLGGLDTDFVTSGWTKDEDMTHMRKARELRLPHFIIDYGKQKFEECYRKRWAIAEKK